MSAPAPSNPAGTFVWQQIADSYDAFVKQCIGDMDRDLRFFDSHVLTGIDQRFFGDCHDSFQHFRTIIHNAFSTEDNLADLQFDLKRAWLAGLLQHCEQPKRQKDASDMLDFIQAHKLLSNSMEVHKEKLSASENKPFEESSAALLVILEDMRKLHEELMRANAQFPGSVADSDLQHLDRWESQRDALQRRAGNRGHTIAVVGLEKTGKSTVCNALVGLRLLPAAVERCTMLTTRIRPSADNEYRMEVTFANEAEFEQALSHAEKAWERKRREEDENRQATDPDYKAQASQFDKPAVRLKAQQFVGRDPEIIVGRDLIVEGLKRYTANADNMLAVNNVTVWTPELKGENMEVVDVPGFDSPLAEHREAAARSLNEADAFIFVTNGAAHVDLTAPALELVRTITKVAPGALDKGYAIVTHLDTSSSRAEFQERRAKAVAGLMALGFNEARIFCACPPLSLLEREQAVGDAMGAGREHFEEMVRKARSYGLQLGFAQMKSSLEEFVAQDLPRRRRREAVTLLRMGERAAGQATERVAGRLKTFLPPDQLSKVSLIEGKMTDATVEEVMTTIATSIARTHNAQWSRLWNEIWAHVNSSAADWLAANYFDRFHELSAEWTKLFQEHYNAEKSRHARELYEKFKSRLSVLPFTLDEPDPCEAEMAHRVWMVETVHTTLAAAASRVARSIYQVLEQYHQQLTRKVFSRFTDDIEHLQISTSQLTVDEIAVRLKVEFNTLQSARLLEKRVLRYPRWHPRRVIREKAMPIVGLYATKSAAEDSSIELGAAGQPQGFPSMKQPALRVEEEQAALSKLLNGEPEDLSATEQQLFKGVKAQKMPASRALGRRGSVHATSVKLTQKDGLHYITWASRNKKGEAVLIPLHDVEIQQGVSSSKSFEALDKRARAAKDNCALSLKSKDRTLDLVLSSPEELDRTVRVLKDLQVKDRERVPIMSTPDSVTEDEDKTSMVDEKCAPKVAAAASAAKEAAAPAPLNVQLPESSPPPSEANFDGLNLSKADGNDVRALTKGLKVTKMPHSRRGSTHDTQLRLMDINGQKVLTYDSRNKWAGDIAIPIESAEVREGPVTDSFDKLGASKSKVYNRALSIQGPRGSLDVVFKSDDEYERAVRGIRALQEQSRKQS